MVRTPDGIRTIRAGIVRGMETLSRYDTILKRLAAASRLAGRLPRGELLDMVRLTEAMLVERPCDDELWSVYRVATYLGLDHDQAIRILKKPGAPRPVDDGDGSIRHAYWRARDIYRWLDAPRHLQAVLPVQPPKQAKTKRTLEPVATAG